METFLAGASTSHFPSFRDSGQSWDLPQISRSRIWGWKKESGVLSIPRKAPSCPIGDKLLGSFSSLGEYTRSQVLKPAPSFPFWRLEEPACASGSHGNRAEPAPPSQKALEHLLALPTLCPTPFILSQPISSSCQTLGAKTPRLLIP